MKKFLILIILLGISFLIFFFFKDNTIVISPKDDANIQQMTDSLDLSNKGLTKIPEDIFSNKAITKLNVSNNNLEGAIQGEVRFLRNLKELNLSNNNLTGVPAEIGQLSKLEILDLSNNKITGLPNEIANLQNLKVLNLKGNNYSEYDLDKILEKLPNTVEVIK